MIASILTFLLVLSILVLVHELGHFIVARKMRVRVEEFGFGIPPRLFGIQKGETLYSVNLLPFGGFVKLYGEDSSEEVTDIKRSFSSKGKLKRFAIVLAGVVMNFLLAIVAFAIVYSFSGIPKKLDRVKIAAVAPGSPAQISGILVGDIIKKVNKVEITNYIQFSSVIGENKGKRTVIEVERTLNENSSTKKITLTPRENPPVGEGAIGVEIPEYELYWPPVWQRPFYGIYYGFKESLFWGKNVLLGFGSLFNSLFKGQVPKDLTGPVGIFAVSSQASKMGVLAVINFIGILSVNLAILNVLPFPALDGGRLLFIAIERVIGKKVLPKIEATIHMIGFVFLILLLLAITAHDIQRLIKFGGISGFIDSVLK